MGYFAYTNREVLQQIPPQQFIIFLSAFLILILAYAIWLQSRVGKVERENDTLQTSHKVAMMYNSLFENAPIWLAVVEVASSGKKSADGIEGDSAEVMDSKGDTVNGQTSGPSSEASIHETGDRRGSGASTVVAHGSTEALSAPSAHIPGLPSHPSVSSLRDWRFFSEDAEYTHPISMLTPRRPSAESVVAMDTGGATTHPRDHKSERLDRYSTTSLLTARTSIGELEGSATMGFNKGASAIVVLPGERQDTNGPPSRSDLHSDSNIASPGSASRPAHGIHSLNDCHEALKIARETGDGKTYDFRILRVNRPVHDKFGLETEGEILEKWIHKDLRRPQGRVDMFCRGLMESRYKGVVEFAVNLPVTMDGKSWRFEMPSTSDAFPNSDKKPIDPHAWRHVSFTCQHIETVQTEDGRENDRFNIVMQDTNAEWEMVKALQMSEERLRQALEATNDGIWEWHIPTGHIRFSERLAKIFGFAPDELEGDITAWDKMVHKDDLSRVQQQRYAHLDGRIPFYDVEKRVRTKSGEWRWIQNRAKVVEWDEHGKAMRMVGAQTDITDRKSFEIALEEKNRQLDLALHQAAAAAQSKSEFLANITHEIRTPLNGIIGLSNILADTTLNDDQKDLLESVRDCSDGLLMIVNDVLDFSKIEAGKLDLENKPFNVHNCLKGALYPLRLRAEEKGIELGTDIRSGTPEWMSGDVHRLRQVLNNLVSNAVKFTSVGAVNVMLSGSIIDDERGKRVRIQCDVKDTGIGIPPNRMDRLFKSFSQVDTSTSRRFGGTGLGLAISKNLVEMMDPEEGRMWVDSEEGKGSTFSFCVCGGWCDEEKGEGIGSANSRTRINATAASRSASTGSVGSVESLGSAASLKSEARGKLLGGVVGKKVVGSPTVESGPANGTGEAGGKEGGVGTTRRRDGERKGLSRQNTELSLLNNRKEKELLLADWLPMNILVAEDNLINQKLALRLLQRQGYIPDMANNGAEAVEAVKQKTFDIILMDVQMPIMSGLEATNLIRNLPRSILPVQPVIIALTANAMVGDKEKCLKSGMESHISKPVKTDQLMRELEVWGAVAKSRKVVAEGNGNRGEMMGLVGDEEMEGVDGGLDGQGGAGGQAHQESSRSTPSLVLP